LRKERLDSKVEYNHSLRVEPSKNMTIVTEFGCDVQTYMKEFKHLRFGRPKVCINCQAVGLCIGHGYYTRKPLKQQNAYVIQIKRWLCKGCRCTISLLPSFMLRYRHYVLEVIQQVVVARFEKQGSWSEVSQRCSKEGAPSERTIKRWSQSFSEQASEWLAIVQQTLATQDAMLPWLDVLGEATELRETGSALLQAATQLLAWAKTNWTEVIAYGQDDRLRFLWHWGHSQGMGRLI